MSTLHGKWDVEDIRDVIKSLDEKTGMDGASLPIYLYKVLGDGNTLGTYHPSNDNKWRSFSFSLAYFNDDNFKDLAAIDVIRHEYCHYLVDALDLNTVFNDKDGHGIAWKTVCGLLNTDDHGKYCEWHFRKTTEKAMLEAVESKDILPVDIICQIDRWGHQLPSLIRRRYLEKKLLKKYTKARIFSINDRVIHNSFGYGTVVDTMPTEKKQLIYVDFDSGESHIVQNRNVHKMINGEVKRPVSKVR